MSSTKYLFHGDNQAESRRLWREAIAKGRGDDTQEIALDGSKIAPRDLESALGSVNLFGSQIIIIENILSRPVSKDRKSLITLLKEYVGDHNIYLWEKKEISKAVINSLGDGWQTKVCKTPAAIFNFLDSIRPGGARESLRLMHQASVESDEVFVFIMLYRHIGELIVASSGDTSKLIPWKRGKLVSQAKSFDENTLVTLHSSLRDIDRQVKSGKTKLSHLSQLDLLLLKVLG